jgi:hypothetical protein
VSKNWDFETPGIFLKKKFKTLLRSAFKKNYNNKRTGSGIRKASEI